MLAVLCVVVCAHGMSGTASLKLFRTNFTGMHVADCRSDRHSISVEHVSTAVRDCSFESAGGLVASYGSVYIEGTGFRGVGSPRTAETLKENERFEGPNQVSVSDGEDLTVTNCSFSDFAAPSSAGAGSCINADPVQDFTLVETIFTNCDGWWGIVYAKATGDFVLDGNTLQSCEGTESLLHCERDTNTPESFEVEVTSCRFLDTIVNTGNKQSGGSGLVFRGATSLNLYNCTFSGCNQNGKTQNEKMGGGCYGTWLTNLKTFVVQGCCFNGTQAVGDGGCFVITKALTFEVMNCTFEGATARNGGVFYFLNVGVTDGADYAGEKAKGLTLVNCTIRNCEARGSGAVTGIKYDGGIGTLTLENTTIDGCKTTGDGIWIDLDVTQSFVFENNTVSNMIPPEGQTHSLIKITMPDSEDGSRSVVFSHCTFSNTVTPGFLIEFKGESSVPTSLHLEECRLVDVTVSSRCLNSLAENSNVPFSFTNCWMDNVRVNGESALMAIETGEVSMTECTFVGCSGTLLRASGGSITLEKVDVVGCTAAMEVAVSTFSAKFCTLSGLALDVTSASITMDNVTMASGSARLALSASESEGTATIAKSDFSIGFTLSGSGTITFEDCCFTGLEGDTHYISSDGGDTSPTLSFTEPMCFDKGKDAAIDGWSNVEGSEDNMYGECVCHVIPDDPTSEPEDDPTTSDAPEPEDDPTTSDAPEPEDDPTTSDAPEPEDDPTTSDAPEPEDDPTTSDAPEPEDDPTTSDAPEDDPTTSDAPEPEDDPTTSDAPEPEDDPTTSDAPEPDPDTHSSDEATEDDTTTKDEEDPNSGGGKGEGDDKGLSPGEAAAIAVVVIAVVVVAIVLVVFFVLRRRRKDDVDDSENEMFDDESVNTASSVELDTAGPDEPGPTNPLFSAGQADEDFSSVFEETPSN